MYRETEEEARRLAEEESIKLAIEEARRKAVEGISILTCLLMRFCIHSVMGYIFYCRLQ